MNTSQFLARSPERVRVFGDWHGNVQFALNQIERGLREGITTFVHVGDFGLWPFGIPRDQWTTRYGFVREIQTLLEEHGAVLGFIDGNHEDFGVLAKLLVSDEGMGVVSANIFYIPRGTVWEWCGTQFGGMGGAVSIDRAMRKPGLTWFPEEFITTADVERTKRAGSVDVLFTHEAPQLPVPKHSFGPAIDADCEQSRRMVATLVDTLKPKVLIHGHYHFAYSSTDEFPGTEVIGLDCDMGIGRDNYVDLVPGTPHLLAGMRDLLPEAGRGVEPELCSRLDQYLSGMSKSRADLVSRAAHYAARLHSNQVRTGFDGSKSPYINHPMRVALKLIDWGISNPEVIAAALLHDTVEDCSDLIETYLIREGTAEQWVRLQFGPRAAGIVSEVTNSKGQIYRDKIVDLAERGSSDALLVKAADLVDNAGSVPSNGGHRGLRLAEKYQPVIPAAVGRLRRLGYKSAADELTAIAANLDAIFGTG